MQTQKASQKLHLIITHKSAAAYICLDISTEANCNSLFWVYFVCLRGFKNIQHTTKADSFCRNWREGQIIDVHAR